MQRRRERSSHFSTWTEGRLRARQPAAPGYPYTQQESPVRGVCRAAAGSASLPGCWPVACTLRNAVLGAASCLLAPICTGVIVWGLQMLHGAVAVPEAREREHAAGGYVHAPCLLQGRQAGAARALPMCLLWVLPSWSCMGLRQRVTSWLRYTAP